MAFLDATASVFRPRWSRVRPCVWLFVALALGQLSVQAALPNREYQVKAIFLYNFVQFVHWPETSFEGPLAPIRIGVLGYDPFDQALEAAIENETVRRRPLQIIRSYRWEDLRRCHLVFISTSERYRLTEVLRGLSSSPVLTVSEIPGFAERGGAINFFLDAQKVRFEINPTAARRHDIKIGAQLLKLARIIGSPSGEAARP